jgi:NADH:ubiquinone oxidoreductase subunit
MTITTRLHTFFSGRLIGADAFGNRYFESRRAPKRAHKKRWVLFNGMAEPSKVPAEWHGWLHYTHDAPPTQRTAARHAWQKQHLPNLTGTRGAYVPPGHVLKHTPRAATTSDYESWTPS